MTMGLIEFVFGGFESALNAQKVHLKRNTLLVKKFKSVFKG
jgi:hypothetical protein